MSNIPQQERKRFVGSSEVASLFSLDLFEGGERVYETRYELHMRKRGLLDKDLRGGASERARWGNRLEAAMAAGFAEDHGFKVRRVRRYLRHPRVDGMGASLDYEVVAHPLGPGDLELKNVDRSVFLDWPEVEGADDPAFVAATGLPYLERRRDPPLRMQLQLQHQLACDGRAWGIIAPLVGGNKQVPIPYPRVPAVVEMLEREVGLFWAEVDAEVPPPPDWRLDAAAVARVHGYADQLRVLNARGDRELLALAHQYRALGERSRRLEARREVLKAQMLERIGDARKALLADGYTISAGMVPGREVNHWRRPHRGFQVNKRKRRR